MFTTNGTYPWSFVTQIFHNGQPSRGGDRKIFEVMTSTLPNGTNPWFNSFLVINYISIWFCPSYFSLYKGLSCIYECILCVSGI